MGIGGLLSNASEHEPFTQIQNSLLRSEKLSVYDKIIYILIASCNPAYPSYDSLQKWSGLSRERVWKSLRTLEQRNIIYRLKKGRSIEYKIFTKIPDKKSLGNNIKYFDTVRSTSSPDELIDPTTSSPDELYEFARRTDQCLTSSPDELQKDKKEKNINLKRSDFMIFGSKEIINT